MKVCIVLNGEVKNYEKTKEIILKENYDYDVIAACIDVGQGTETDGLEEKALKTGAIKYYLINSEHISQME